MTRLLLRSGARHHLRHPWQLALSVLGIALGVAVVASIDLAIGSARRAFELSTETVTGRATHEIRGGPAGLADSLYRTLRVEAGVRPSAPVVEGYVRLPAAPGLTLRLLGVDPFAEAPFRPWLGGAGEVDMGPLLTRPGAVLLARGTARELGLEPGDSFAVTVGGAERRAWLAGTLEPADELSRRALEGLVLADVATAQELLGTPGRLDRIELAVPEGPAGRTSLERAAAALPPGATLAPTAARGGVGAQLTEAFDLNLRALSLLALVFGAFLIYNSMTFSVVQRRAWIGVLRALGVTRGEVFGLVLAEAAVIGALASALGLALGVLLGDVLVDLVTRTINDLYFVVTVREVSVPAATLAKGAALGVGGTVLAAVAPALEATTAPPHAALARSALESRVRGALPRLTAAGALMLALGGALMAAPGRSLAVSFAGVFAVVFGAALLAPPATVALTRLLRPFLGRVAGLLGRMAAGGVAASLSRTAPAIAALAVAVSVGVAVGVMIASFRGTVERWLGQTLQADVYVSAPGTASNRSDALLDPALARRIAAAPGVAGVSTYRNTAVQSPALGEVQLTALDPDPRHYGAFDFKQGERDAALAAFAAGRAVLITEPFAFRHDLGVGSRIPLRTDRGVRNVPVAGVFYDYASERGVVFMARRLYDRLWDDPALNSAAVFAEPGTEPDALVRRLRALAGEETVLIRSSGALRAASLEVFDRTFAITAVLRTLALGVAFIGVVSALMALQLERARELGVLRATGVTPGQLRGLVVAQTGLMGLAAGLLALPFGALLAWAMVHVVNRRSFGWTMPLEIQSALFLQGLALAVVAALLAGAYPAWRMSRTAPAEALREE